MSHGLVTVDPSTVTARRRSRPRASRTTTTMKTAAARVLLGVLGTLAVCATSVPTAGAATLVATATLRPGGLTVSAAPARVDAADPRLLDVPLEVIDARGNGAGWSVYLAASPAQGASSSPAFASVLAPALACAPDVTCTLAQSSVTYPLTMALSGSPVKVLNALPNTGMGAQTATVPLLEPSSGTPASLQTTVTVSSGP